MNWLSNPNPWLLSICSGLMVNLFWAFILAGITWIRLPQISKTTSTYGSTKSISFPEFTIKQLPMIVFESLIVLPLSSGIIYLYIQIQQTYQTGCFIVAIWFGLLILSGYITEMGYPSSIEDVYSLLWGIPEIIVIVIYDTSLVIGTISILFLIFGSPLILAYLGDLYGFKDWVNTAATDIIHALENLHNSFKK
jgi:hypothetical protein